MSIPSPVSNCARAATAQEAAFRIDYPLASARNTRVVALDAGAAEIVRAASTHQWEQAKFYSTANAADELVSMAGEVVPLVGEIVDTNTVIMVATTGVDPEAIATIGAACAVRGIMTAGLVMVSGQLVGAVVGPLRPYTRMLLVPAEPDDLIELLRAMRS